MKLYTISEECHGFIGVGTSVRGAIKGLIEHNWLTENYDCDVGYDEVKKQYLYTTIKEKFGRFWKAKILNFSLEEFNEIFDGSFLICEIEAWE